MENRLASDLDEVLALTVPVWGAMRRSRVFITGGTGFFGRWLLESLVWANDRGDAHIDAVVLSRNPAKFAVRAPHLAAHPRLSFVKGDVRTFEFPAGEFPYLIHGATETAKAVAPGEAHDSILRGTIRVLDFAAKAHTRRFLYISSGAVYGRLTAEVPLIEESEPAIAVPGEVYDEYRDGKRTAELSVNAQSLIGQFEACIARCFAFHGPYLPLDAHYAIGNFLGNRLRGEPIRVSGDGSPLRSYLYAGDLAVWLWTLLARGGNRRAYNVGSEVPISIGELARVVGAEFEPRLPVTVAGTPSPNVHPPSYVPSTKAAQAELGLRETVPLREGLVRTLRWLQAPE